MKYVIRAREIHIQGYAVEADSPQDAIRKFNNGEGEIHGNLEYSQIEDVSHVNDEHGNCVLDREGVEAVNEEDPFDNGPVPAVEHEQVIADHDKPDESFKLTAEAITKKRHP
jgi:hypothetical protein